MQYVRLGNAGIQVSRLSLGCMDFPLRLGEVEASKLVDRAMEMGVNLLDTADTYDKGASEEILGKILKGRRDRIILATKFWAPMYDRPNGGGCSRVHIMQAVEDSLRRLQTDHIDLYQLHHPDSNTPVEEVLSTMDTLVKQGKIRYIGVSNHYSWQMAHMLGVSALHSWEPLVSIQCRYNTIDRVIENETVPFCERFNIGTLIYGPLSGGILAGKISKDEGFEEGSRLYRLKGYQKKLTEDVWHLLDDLRTIAEKNNVGMNQLAFVWLLSKPVVTTILMGGSKPEHYEAIYGLVDVQIDPEDLQKIDELSEQWRYQPFHNQRMTHGGPLAQNWW